MNKIFNLFKSSKIEAKVSKLKSEYLANTTSGGYQIPNLPLSFDIETKEVLKRAVEASRALAELKNATLSIPNENILINTLALQEAKDSSEIENIITTSDDLYQSDYNTKHFVTQATKEVHNYSAALSLGYSQIRNNGLLTNKLIKEIQSCLIENNAGFRTQGGTNLKNASTNEVIYTPPQTIDEINSSMANLETFINNDELSNIDPLIKMALIHHQFESIHPFFDGNGRTGRIINILYLVKQELLHSPILYLSRYINKNKSDYYRLLQGVRDNNSWEEWVLFILNAVLETSKEGVKTIQSIAGLMQECKIEIKEKLPKLYSHELLNNLFSHPYTKVQFLISDLDIHENTSRKYLNSLAEETSFISKTQKGKENYYINTKLYELLQNINS